MHILLLPSWYSTIDKPWRGAFFKDQAKALIDHGLRAGIAFVERRSLSRVTPAGLVRHHFQTTSGDEDDVPTFRMKGWSTFAQTTAGSMLWCNLTRSLVRSYVAIHGVPDVIHGHAAMWGGYAAMLCARDLGRPYVVTEHASSILTLHVAGADRRRVASVYRNAKGVITVSDALKASVDCLAHGAIASVIPNTVDLTCFDLPPARRQQRPFVFLAAGDLVPSKRVEMLIRAFARLHTFESQTKLVIVGSGRESSRLRELAWELDVHEAVEFTGALVRAGVRQQMWKANALVMASDFETFGVVLIEALATGMPVIATRCGGPEEIVTPDLGTLVECNDESALLLAMLEILGREFDPIALRANVSRRFGYRHVAQQLCGIYESAAARRQEVA
jgi:L-malate glycosyltransferase